MGNLAFYVCVITETMITFGACFDVVQILCSFCDLFFPQLLPVCVVDVQRWNAACFEVIAQVLVHHDALRIVQKTLQIVS